MSIAYTEGSRDSDDESERPALERMLDIIHRYKLTIEPVHITYQGVLNLSNQQHNAWNIVKALERRTSFKT